MTQPRWEEARRAACQAAADAWLQIAELYEKGSHVEQTAEGPSTEADKLADKLIAASLKRAYPESEFGYLTEETEDDRARLERSAVWIVDPIDGTKDFIKKNGNFAMHVGLAERQEDGRWRPVAAAVYWPARGEMYSATRGGGACLQTWKGAAPEGESRRLAVSRRAPIAEMKAVISNSHRTTRLSRLIESLKFQDMLSIGSIGVKLALIARGDYDVYVNLARGKCREWDVCAPELILSEAGGVLTGLDGSALHYNKTDVYDRQGLLASNAMAHADVQSAIARFEAENPTD